MSEVVGFAGRAGTGKTTAALVLHDLIQPQDGHHIEFSDPIMRVANEWMEASAEAAGKATSLDMLGDVLVARYHVNPRSLIAAGHESCALDKYMPGGEFGGTGQINPENKKDFRGLLEWLGKSSLEHLSPTFWADIVEHRVKTQLRDGADLVTIGGVRSVLDAQAVRNVGGSVIRLRRGTTTKLLPTERGINSWKPDYEVSNQGSVDDLRVTLSGIRRVIPTRPIVPARQNPTMSARGVDELGQP